MQLRLEDVSPVEKKLVVEVPWDTVSARLGTAYKEIGKDAHLRGFRPGKAPRAVLEQVYGRRVDADVATTLLEESFYRAISEHKLEAVAPPRFDAAPSKIVKGQPLAFAAIIEVKGSFEPQGYKGLEIERRKVVVTDEQVDKAIEQLRRDATELLPIEGRDVLAATDVVALEIKGTVGENTVDHKQFVVELDNAEREAIPGLHAALVGLPLATKDKVLDLQVPADHEDPQMRGQAAHLTFSVVEARAKQMPALDDEFAKDTGKGQTLAELKAAVRAELVAKETEVVNREARRLALRALVKQNPIAVANTLVDRAIAAQYRRLQQMFGMQASALGAMGDKLKAEMRPGAIDEVRGELLIDAIAAKETIAITDEEIENRLQAVAVERNTTAARVRAELERDGRMDNVTHSIRHDKTLDLLVTHAKITEVDKLTQDAGPDLGDAPIADGHDDHAKHDHAGSGHDHGGHVHGPGCNH
ncbi:MAG: trigger factor [Myxococcales bacterium]|nr:trigger factor [Myxococcales bacterium]